MKATPVTGGVRFTELPCRIDYFSTDKHQHGRVAASKAEDSSWCIARDAEAEAFCGAARGAGCRDQNGNVWYAERHGTRLVALGTADEKLALFQEPSNEFDDWHGHPRGHRGREDYPDSATLRSLKEAGIITNVEYSRMVGGNIP
jgi:hypothetical protein